MSGYRDDQKLTATDRHTLGWHSAHYGIGLLALGFGSFVVGAPPIFSAITALIGLPLLVYGLRNP